MPLTNPGVFNIVKGKWRYYCELPGTDDSIVFVIIKAPTQADDLMNNFDNLASLLAQNPEADFVGYVRKEVNVTGVSGVNIIQNNTTNAVDVDAPDQTWGAAQPANALGGMIVAYKPTATSTDPDYIPLFYFPYVGTTNGSDLIATVHANGLAGDT